MKDNHCTEIITQLLPGNSRRLLLLASLWFLALTSSGTLMAQSTTKNEVAAKLTEPAATSDTAADVSTEKEPPVYQSREERDMTLLANSQNDATVVWLEAMNTPFLSLFEQELTGNPVGAVLILNAEDQHSNWPNSSEPIRLSLPAFGWSSLSTQLPTPNAEPVPKRTLPVNKEAKEIDSTQESEKTTVDDSSTEQPETTQAPAETSKTESLNTSENTTQVESNLKRSIAEKTPSDIPVEEIALSRVQETINFLHSKGQYNIVLMGNGVGAARATCFINQLDNASGNKQTRMIRALVLINARNQISGSDRQLPQCLINPEIPVLDVYTGVNNRDRQEAKQRLKSSRLNNYSVYQQIRLPIVAHNSMLGENRLSRRIRGFLESHARGVKVDNAIIVDR